MRASVATSAQAPDLDAQARTMRFVGTARAECTCVSIASRSSCGPAVASVAMSSIVPGRFVSERTAGVVRPAQYTVAPASPSSTAMPRPAPRVAPAARATLPADG